MKIKLKKVRKDAKIPKYMTQKSAGLDIYACISSNITLKPGQRILIPTGIAISLPDGYEAQIRPRSGLALNYGIIPLNTPGTIDADYRGEIKIILANLGENEFTIKNGDRIAQMVINKIEKVEFVEVEELDNSLRGDGGFGSTGI